MADDNYEFGTMDTKEQKQTYHAVMDFSAKWGTPISAGLAGFFTSLLLGFGFASVLVFLIIMIMTRIIATTFFMH